MRLMAVTIAALFLISTTRARGDHTEKGEETDADGKGQQDGDAGGAGAGEVCARPPCRTMGNAAQGSRHGTAAS